MSTIGVFLALGGGAVAAGGGGNNGGGDKGSQHQAGSNGGNGGGDNGGKGDGGNGHGHKGGNGGNGDNNGDNNTANDSGNAGTNPNPALNFTTREGDSVKSDPSSDEAVASASCEDGETLVGGGVRTGDEKDQVRGHANESKPMVMSSGPDGNQWTARVLDYAGVGLTARAYAICASSTSSK